MAVPLFGDHLSEPTMDQRRQHAFSQLKIVCVPILSAARQPFTAATTAALVTLLGDLSRALSAVPSAVFSPALANYVFFPLSSLLQPPLDGSDRGEAVLEATMGALATLVVRWRRAGIEMRVLHELWIMTALKLGGPLDPAGPNRGKGKARAVTLSEEAQRAVLRVLLAIMQPLEPENDQDDDDDDDPLGATIDWDADEPAPAPKLARPAPPPLLPPPPIPILFHTLTTLLAISSTPTSLPQLQLSALTALRILIVHYLAPHASRGPSPLLATALPGTASTLSRIALSVPQGSAPDQARRQPSAAIVASLDVLALVVVEAVSDDVTRELRKDAEPPAATLEEVVEAWRDDSPPAPEVESTQAPPLTGPTLPTTAWLTHTLGNLSTLLSSLNTLTAHDSPVVRTALVSLLARLVATCSSSLGSSAPLLDALLVLSSDDWPGVSTSAHKSLLASLAIPSHRTTASTLVLSRLSALPRALLRGDERSAVVSARVIRVALDLLGANDTPLALGRGSWALVRALAFERVGQAGESGMKSAWITAGEALEQGGQEWPELRMKAVKEHATRAALGQLWAALGRWASSQRREGDVVEMFWQAAKGDKAEGALVALDGVVGGLEGTSKRARKVVRALVKDVLAMLEDFELDDDDAPEAAAPPDPTATTDDSLLGPAEGDQLVSIEHQRGVSLTPGLDSLQPVAAAGSAARDALASRRMLLTCLSLRLLATSATVLGTAFSPSLLAALYHLLASLSPSSHPLLRLHASTALAQIAFATSYASPSNLVLSHVDYVVNAVSQRLTPARLVPAAPLVLVEMVRLVGAPIVPMVQDLVEDVFEALDDYHGYDELTVGLWAVLDALVRAMASGEDDERAEDRPPPDVGPKPDPERDFAAFEKWYATRAETAAMDDDDFGPNPQKPFESTVPPPPHKDDDAAPSFPDSLDVVATRPQSTASAILSKASYFLSHSSPFLRARVLALLATAVPLLRTQTSLLLPSIHRSWPLILNRLSDPSQPVVLEAAGLVQALAEHVGSFMSRRILDDVWPRFRSILLQPDPKSADRSKYAGAHRLHRAILSTMRAVARDVPLKEDVVWDQAVLFRVFLDSKREIELQQLAMGLYRRLASVNEDAVWLALEGAKGDRAPLFLRMDEDVEENTRTLLLEMKG